MTGRHRYVASTTCNLGCAVVPVGPGITRTVLSSFRQMDYGLLAGALIVLAAFAGATILVSRGAILPGEDASILFTYAANFADTGVIAFYREGPRAEGATDFLIMIVLAGLRRLGLRVEAGAALVSTGAALVVFAAVYEIIRRELEPHGALHRTMIGVLLAVVLIGTTFLFAAFRGFSIYFFLAPISLMVLFHLRGNGAGFLAAALWTCLARPDGVVFAAPLTALLLWKRRHDRRTWLLFAAILALPGIGYFLWRASYFGEWLPLPFYVKAAGDRDVLGLFYVESIMSNTRAMLHAVTLIFVVLAITTPRHELSDFLAANFALLLTFSAGFAFYAAVKQEQNEGFRFQAPLYLLTLILFLRLPAAAETRLRLLLVAGLIALPAIHGAFRDTTALARDDNITPLAGELRTLPRGSMLVTEAGRLPFRSGWVAIDSWGLNTPELARRVILPEDIERYGADLIVVHSFDPVPHIQGLIFQRETERTWDNHARNILLGAAGKYDTYFVPFYRLDSQSYRRYPRHDIYLVRRDSPIAGDLQAMIGRYGGVTIDQIAKRFRISVG